MSGDITNTTYSRPIKVTIQGAVVNISGGEGGVTDGDKGDILVSNSGSTWTIENMSENATVTTGTYNSKVNQALLIKARKSTAGTITKGQIVYITGSSGDHLLVELAQANAEATSAYTIGVAATNITDTVDGFIMQAGRLSELSTLPTATYTNGDSIYLSETTAGGYRKTIPEAPNHGVFIGFVVRSSNGGAGELDIRIQNYQELEELSDVYVTGANVNDFLVKKTTRWENTTSANVKTILDINNVDNTSDLNKPISTATQTALDAKQSTLVSGTNIKTIEGQSLLGSGNIDLTKSDVGLSNVDNTSDVNKPISTATQTALNGKEPTITAGTTGQYYRGDKTFQTLDKTAVGLGNVDNTSDLNKPISTATQTALDGKVDENSAITGATKTKITYDAKGLVTAGADAAIADITGLQTALDGKASTSLVSTSASGLQPATGFGTITYSATTNLDMASLDGQYQTITLTGNLTFTTSNRANGRKVVIRLLPGASQRTLTFPVDWVFVSTKPADIAANKTGVLSLTFFGTADTDCVAAYAVQS